MEASRTVLASDGPEALSLSKVANLAGINRGTAYQHFATREELIKATVGSVGELLSTRVFSHLSVNVEGIISDIRARPIYDVIASLVEFSVENPNLGRIWLFDVLSSDNPSEDLFFRQFKETTRQLAESEYSHDGIDVEALSVIMLAGYFLWPEWVKGHAKTDKEKGKMIARMRHEVLRLFIQGVIKPGTLPELDEILSEDASKV